MLWRSERRLRASRSIRSASSSRFSAALSSAKRRSRTCCKLRSVRIRSERVLPLAVMKSSSSSRERRWSPRSAALTVDLNRSVVDSSGPSISGLSLSLTVRRIVSVSPETEKSASTHDSSGAASTWGPCRRSVIDCVPSPERA
jgi:hypothetical protein